MTEKIPNRIALITGASRGIGAAIAKALGAGGVHVVLVARTVGGLEEVDDAIRAAGGTASLVPMDLRQHGQIDQLGATLFERYKKLDILIGNAAMLGHLSPVAHAEPRVFDDVFAVNVTANYRLIRACDPLLRASIAGRVVMVSSGAAKTAHAYWGPYGASKAALEALTLSYAAEVAKTAMRVNLLDPGVVRTKMRAQAFPGENPATLPEPESVVPTVLSLVSPELTVPHGRRVVV
jgi:NAD(P)-dependent dehydrogenase (short-subunit alcohol dehydrogenase family)